MSAACSRTYKRNILLHLLCPDNFSVLCISRMKPQLLGCFLLPCSPSSCKPSGDARDDSGANIFPRYSKWHRLNQEVKKTTKKNKLDKFHHLCHFEADLGSAATHSWGVWIGREKHIDGKPKSKKLWKGERHIGSCPVSRCVLGSLS